MRWLVLGSVVLALVGGWVWLMLVTSGAAPETTEKLRLLRRLLAPQRRVLPMPQMTMKKIDRFKVRLRRSA